jgi:hypothetical protein
MNKKVRKKTGLGKLKGDNKALLQKAGEGVLYTALKQLIIANEIIKLIKNGEEGTEFKTDVYKVACEYLKQYEDKESGTTES